MKNIYLYGFLLVLSFLISSSNSLSRTLEVGSGKTYPRLQAAAQQAQGLCGPGAPLRAPRLGRPEHLQDVPGAEPCADAAPGAHGHDCAQWHLQR